MNYQELVQRNWAFISPEEQGCVARTTVFLAGCGLGSVIGVLAARTGFQSFILADGDNVEVSNLNRQAFRAKHVGKNKARATAALIKEVNPAAVTKVIPRFLEAADAPKLVPGCDVIVNMVDPGPAMYALLTAAEHHRTMSLFPLNIGFGGVVLAFGAGGASLADLVGEGAGDDYFLRLVERLMPLLPSYLTKFLWALNRIEQEKLPLPQLGIASSISASLVVTAMVKIAVGAPVPLAPSVLTLDSWESTVGAWSTPRSE